MSFQPILPLGGYSGWTLLQRSLPLQQKAHDQSAPRQREEAWFREGIAKITSADELVADHRLLKVVLTAFGLEADLPNKAFIKKVLEGDPSDAKALANRLADKSYKSMATTLGFGGGSGAQTLGEEVIDQLVSAWRSRGFEAAVGEQNGSYRLAMNAARELPSLARGTGSDAAQWFSIMGSKPLREVVQTALGLPASVASLDLDQQLVQFRSRARAVLGSDQARDLGGAATLEKLTRLYVIRADLNAGAAVRSSRELALQLLSGTT